jgi:hypothetical protein
MRFFVLYHRDGTARPAVAVEVPPGRGLACQPRVMARCRVVTRPGWGRRGSFWPSCRRRRLQPLRHLAGLEVLRTGPRASGPGVRSGQRQRIRIPGGAWASG